MPIGEDDFTADNGRIKDVSQEVRLSNRPANRFGGWWAAITSTPRSPSISTICLAVRRATRFWESASTGSAAISLQTCAGFGSGEFDLGRLITLKTPFIPIPAGPITVETVAVMIANFHDVYALRSGNRFPAIPVQGVTYRLEVVLPTTKVEYPKLQRRTGGGPHPGRSIDIRHLTADPLVASEYQREALLYGDVIQGPAVIREQSSTTFMLLGQELSVGEYGELHIRRRETGAGKDRMTAAATLARSDELTGFASPEEVDLRDLTDAEFLVRYKTERFTASILASRMRYVVKHMSTVVLTTAFSMILRDWYDFAVTISGPREMNYPMSTGSDSLSIFMFTMPEGIRNTIEEFGPENIKPGDVIVTNDPYRAGLHVNDVSFIRPIFYRGRIVSFVAVRAHQLDMGGTVAGGFSGTKRNVYETGLVIPPMLLYRADKPVAATFNLIFDNARYADLLLPD